MKIAGAIFVLTMSLSVAGCGGPESPSAPAPSAPLHLSGVVLDSGYRRLAGAKVEVVDGPDEGVSTMADAAGQFLLAARLSTTGRLRASKDGYAAVTQAVGFPSVFDLAALAPPVNIAGEYSMTFSADPACVDLPNEARVRTYAATIAPAPSSSAPANTSFRLTVSGAPFLPALNGFSIGVSGDYLGFFLDGGHDAPIVEQIATSTYVAISGNAGGSIGTPTGSTISASLEGWIEYCVMPSPMTTASNNCGTSNITGEPIPGAAVVYAHCESKAHRLTLTRR